jgi:hypothetical protein
VPELWPRAAHTTHHQNHAVKCSMYALRCASGCCIVPCRGVVGGVHVSKTTALSLVFLYAYVDFLSSSCTLEACVGHVQRRCEYAPTAYTSVAGGKPTFCSTTIFRAMFYELAASYTGSILFLA